MKMNFSKIGDEILDIQLKRTKENSVFVAKICRWLKKREDNRLDFSEIKYTDIKPCISFYGCAKLKVDYIEYIDEIDDFTVRGTIDKKNEIVTTAIDGSDLDLNSIATIVEWISIYQQEQD